MICGEGRAVVQRPAREVLETVLDLEHYREADHKIGRVYEVRRDAGGATVRFRPRFRGLPAPPVTQRLELTPWTRIEVSDVPSWVTAFSTFHGVVECEEREGGTHVLHRECLTFRGPLRWVLEPMLRGWLARDTEEEVRRLAAMLGG